MWSRLVSILLRYRLAVLLAVGVVTCLMATKIPDLRLVYEFGGLLPKDHPTRLEFEDFVEHFGAEGNLFVLGVNDDKIHTPEGLQAWHDLSEDIKDLRVHVKGVETEIIDSVFCITQAFTVEKDSSDRSFVAKPIANDLTRGGPALSQRVDSLISKVKSLKFFEGVLHNEGSDATIMMVFLDPTLFNSKDRGNIVEDITALSDEWSEKMGVKVYLSGLPFIRIQMTNKVKGELGYFVGAALLVTFILLLLFFRNFTTALVCLSVVFVGVIISTGSIAAFDYPITLLMSLIPPLIIVIGVPNCIYLVNKYHADYKKHGNKVRALQRMITKVGNATLLTNLTTAFGFATFMFTRTDFLQQFGTIAAVNIMAVFVISLSMIPTILYLLPDPSEKQFDSFNRKWVFKLVQGFVDTVQHERTKVYLFSVVVLIFSLAGVVQMRVTGNIVDDLPKDDRVLTDLAWIEENFNGVMPFEALIDCGEEGKAL